ncbi:acyl carrier protein [Streptomonospora litoralis]|uniref:D-alanine--poly(Phosphoribitol) ligase subunit 2 n=1 Tax=Streptomonospora litoralis TaxID=2498135 RepID=A0A4P6Q2X4_9ACTN|nr:acyl carrier protein [Streptomonospora litoralis]QBI54925.1 D-alanine--poly(phosphoribitol) ligase subunit 2 [Streptomonospora litoralis]
MSHTDAIRQFVITEFLPDLDPGDLADDHDLITDSVIDSVGTLKLIAWVENTFDLRVGDTELDPDNFRTVTAIDSFIARMREAEAAEN